MTAAGTFANPDNCPHPISARVWPILRIGRYNRYGPHDAVALCHDCGMWKTPHGWSR